MADDTNPDNNGVLDLGRAVRERDDYRLKYEQAQERIRELNGEAKGHRLNADNFRTVAEERAAKLAEKEAAHAAALEAARAELTGKVTEAEARASEALTKAQQRAVRADLRIAAKDAGMVDLDGLALLDMNAVQVSDDGDVTNAADLMAALRKAKPYLFGAASTSSTATPPAGTKEPPKSAREMTADQLRAFEREHGIVVRR